MVSAVPMARPAPRAPVLQRTAFSTSRMMEFFTEKELRMQLGMDRWHWPVALTKELIDNALDACEVAGVAPDHGDRDRPHACCGRQWCWLAPGRPRALPGLSRACER